MPRIETMLIPEDNIFTRPGIAMNPKYITLHNTDNYNPGANAYAHARLQTRGNSRQASWHYTCGSDGIYQSIPNNEVAWSNGDGNGDGNMKSISIEICVNPDGNYYIAEENAIWLIKKLMIKYNIPISNVVPHKHWSGKNCPREILADGWDKFISRIEGVLEGSNEKNKSNPPYPKKIFKNGSRGCEVQLIQLKLGNLTVDGIYGKKSETRVRSFQEESGISVDGIVGSNTWGKLFG